MTMLVFFSGIHANIGKHEIHTRIHNTVVDRRCSCLPPCNVYWVYVLCSVGVVISSLLLVTSVNCNEITLLVTAFEK